MARRKLATNQVRNSTAVPPVADGVRDERPSARTRCRPGRPRQRSRWIALAWRLRFHLLLGIPLDRPRLGHLTCWRRWQRQRQIDYGRPAAAPFGDCMTIRTTVVLVAFVAHSSVLPATDPH